MSDESRKKILARRASFVAAALAGVACGKDAEAPPQPCLSQVYVPEDAGAASNPTATTSNAPPEVPPQPCLSPPPEPIDAGPPPPPPMPCLSIRMDPDAGKPPGPPPRPCLTPKRP